MARLPQRSVGRSVGGSRTVFPLSLKSSLGIQPAILKQVDIISLRLRKQGPPCRHSFLKAILICQVSVSKTMQYRLVSLSKSDGSRSRFASSHTLRVRLLQLWDSSDGGITDTLDICDRSSLES